jgi:hypothetical protein
MSDFSGLIVTFLSDQQNQTFQQLFLRALLVHHSLQEKTLAEYQ